MFEVGRPAIPLSAVGLIVASISRVAAMEMFPMPEDLRHGDYRAALEELILGVNTLQQAGYEFDEFPPDMLAIYYNDFVLLELVESGAASFRQEQLPLHPLTERDILNGLDLVGAGKLKQLFDRYFVAKVSGDAQKIDTQIGEALEDLQEMNSRLHWNSDQIT